MATHQLSAALALCVTCVAIAVPAKAQWLVDDVGCRTPSRGVGECRLIKDCQAMITFIQQNAPLSPKEVEVLRSYQCGFEGREVKVCCPDGPITIGKPRNPLAPDVSNHRNLRLLPQDCGLLSFRDRIINGNKTSLFEFPWMALLSYQTNNGPEFKCGGSIINNRYILTAAHCISHLSNLKLIGVRVGEYDISKPVDCEEQEGTMVCAPPVQDVAVEQAIPHPRYNATSYTDDIGLVRLASPIDTSVESVKPICLPTIRELRNINFTNTKLTVTGWGTTETGRRSNDLLKVDIPVTAEDNCQKAYEKSQAKITYKQICAGGKNRRDSCGGDSGGPLQGTEAFLGDVRYIQWGIVSFGPRFCGQEGFPGVYTRVDYYMDWILDNMSP